MMICDRWGGGGPLQLSEQLSIIYWCLFNVSIVLQERHGNTHCWSEKVTLQSDPELCGCSDRQHDQQRNKAEPQNVKEKLLRNIKRIYTHDWWHAEWENQSLHVKKKSLLSTRRSNDMSKQFYKGNYFRSSMWPTDSVHLHPQRSLMNNVWRVNLNIVMYHTYF